MIRNWAISEKFQPLKHKSETTETTNRHYKENIWLTELAVLSQKVANQLPKPI